MPLSPAQTFAAADITARAATLSEWTATIFEHGETAWREYRSAEWYVDRLRAEGFTVEAGSAGMPTAFCADWSNGDGPIIGLYAEYDVVPGNCQAASTPARASGWAIRRAGIPIRIRALASAGLARCWPPRRRWKSMG